MYIQAIITHYRVFTHLCPKWRMTVDNLQIT